MDNLRFGVALGLEHIEECGDAKAEDEVVPNDANRFRKHVNATDACELAGWSATIGNGHDLRQIEARLTGSLQKAVELMKSAPNAGRGVRRDGSTATLCSLAALLLRRSSALSPAHAWPPRESTGKKSGAA